jgi:predicted nucleic acid-binding protein
MITAVDSSVLIDVLIADPEFGPRSRSALERARLEGSITACDVVWAEVAGRFDEDEGPDQFMRAMGVDYEPLTSSSAYAAGAVWRRYRQAGGPRERLIADFLIGAHAVHQADRLLTRDRGFYRRYFSTLQLLDPMA